MNWNKLRIGQRLGIGFGISIMLMMAITGISAFQLFRSNIPIHEMVHKVYPQTALINTIKDDLASSVGNMRNILITNDPTEIQNEMEELEQSSQFIAENSASLGKVMGANREERQYLEILTEKREAFTASQNRFLTMVKNNKFDDAKNFMLTEVGALAQRYVSAVDNLAEHQRKRAETAGVNMESANREALLVMVVLASMATAVGIAIATIITRGITAPLIAAVNVAERVADGDLTTVIEINSTDEVGSLMQSLRHMNESLGKIVGDARRSTDNIALASVEIATGTNQLSSRTEQQARSLRETAKSIGQLNATVRQNADSAELANKLTDSASSAASQGRAVVSRVISTMDDIRGSSRRIGDITGVIDGIAFQTNILALNAAVEAARAGEYGRGFAVVAAEVRGLAQRAAAAAKEIRGLITESMEKVERGSALVDETGHSMDEIVAAVKKVDGIMEGIALASKVQSVGIEAVTKAINEMEEMTHQNANMVEEATVATESMKDQAASLALAFSVFEIASPAGNDEADSSENGESACLDYEEIKGVVKARMTPLAYFG